jgi:flagellar hook-associated protein 2
VDKGDGTSQSITVSSTSTVGDVISQLKDAGLNASLDTTNSRIFVSSKSSGADNDFNLVAGDENGIDVLSKLGLSASLTKADGSDTSAATMYKKYSSYAKDSNGNLLTAQADVENNIKTAAGNYKTASDAYNTASTQLSNLTSALPYAKAYSEVQDFNNTYGTQIGNTDRFSSVMSVTSDSRDNTLVTTDGKLYTKTSGTDTNGDTVYGYVASDGTKTYVSKEVIYKDTSGTTYKKNDSGQYVQVDANGTAVKDSAGKEIQYSGDTSDLKEQDTAIYHAVTENITYKGKDSNGNETEYTVQSRDIAGTDADGNATTTKQYYFTADGKEYVSDSESGTFTNSAGDTIAITKSYSYTQNGTVSGIETAAEAYDKYKNAIATQLKSASTDTSYTEEDAKTDAESKLSAYATNLSTVKSFEGKVTDTETVQYSRLKIMNDVHAAYTSGTAAGVDDLLENTYAGKISSLKTEVDAQQKIMDDNSAVASLASLDENSQDYKDAVSALATKAMTAASVLSSNSAGTATKMDGQDSIIKLNDVEYKGSSNSLEVNGITVNALAVTGDGDDNAITITTATDTQGIYDKIKDFLTEYNSIINEMCKLYNADSSSGYDPLTDDEKEEMSDSEVEKWETKIKDSLLRHDSTLNSVMTSMTNAMAKSIKINGKNYSLSSFGISTLGYLNSAENENYAYHIDGDEDDSNTSGKTDKLMAAISSDPDTVTSFFQQLTSNLYDAIGSKMKSTSLSSIYTIYNDKQMDTQYKEYTTLISEWETRISDKEEYYYNKFSTMESSLATLNNTQSSLSSYFG